MDKDNVYTHMYIHKNKYYSVINRMRSCHFVAIWIDLEGNMLSEISQIEGDNTVYSYIYVES